MPRPPQAATSARNPVSTIDAPPDLAAVSSHGSAGDLGVDAAAGGLGAGHDRYTLLGEPGPGGLGRVFSASDDTLGRPVAIKQPLSSSPESLARFEREAKITARLQHAGVVPVYDYGSWAEGGPFFAMKMVEGRSLHELIKERASLDERMALVPRVLAVADTIAYAHSQGVIHRDLKPSNVVVGDFGETVVIDWGLARLAASLGDDRSRHDVPDLDEADALPSSNADVAAGLTQFGRVLGTPQFMPPEQALAQPVDERADVYALGAILYNVLAGREPFPGDSKTRALAQAQSESPRPLATWVPGVPEDLAAIVEKAMARDPQQRYASARALADDLRRFLDGRLVSIHRYSLWTLLRRWTRRHRVAVTLSGGLLVALVVSAVMGVRGVVAERNAALRAQQATAARENALTLMQAERTLADDPTAAVAWLKRYRPTTEQAWVARSVADEAVALGVARHVFAFARPAPAIAVSPVAPTMAVGRDGGVTLYDLVSGAQRTVPGGHATVNEVAFSPADGRLAFADVDGAIHLARADGPTQTLTPQAGPIWGLRFSPDGKRLAVVTRDGRALVIDVLTTLTVASFPLSTRASGVDFCSGALFVTNLEGHLYELPDGARAPRMVGNAGRDARVHCTRDGRNLVTADLHGNVNLWPGRIGPPRLLGKHDDWVSTVDSSPDGSQVVTAGGDDTVRIFAVDGGATRVLRGHKDIVRGAVFSPDGALLVTASFDSAVRIWDAHNGELLREYQAVKTGTTRLHVGHDGKTIVASGPAQARVWPLDVLRVRALAGNTDQITAFAWSDDSRYLATTSRDRTVRRWDLRTGATWVSQPLDSWTMFVRFTADDRLLVGTRLGRTRLFDPARGQVVELAAHDDMLSIPSHDRRKVAYLREGTVIVKDLESGREVKLVDGPAEAADLVFSHDSKWVSVVTRQGLYGLWDCETGQARSRHVTSHGYFEVEIAPDGKWGALLTAENRFMLWDLAADRLYEVPSNRVRGDALFITSDSRMAGFKAWDNTLRVVDVATRTMKSLRGHRKRMVRLVRARHEQPWVATSDQDGFIRLWDLAGNRTAVIHAHRGVVDNLRFSPDGRWLASSSEDAAVKIWDLTSVRFTTARDTDDQSTRLAHTTTAAISADSALATP